MVDELYLLSQTVGRLRAELVKIDDQGLFDKLEIPLISVLAEMEINGVAVDQDMLGKLSKEAAMEEKKV